MSETAMQGAAPSAERPSGAPQGRGASTQADRKPSDPAASSDGATGNAPAIELRGLTKDYGDGRGAFDVSFTVRRGEAFGFLGPNGTGKTVTMRNLMGFVRPDAGAARIGGLDCFRDRARIQEGLGYLPGEIACMDEMTGTAFLEFMARMRRLRDRSRMHELIERFELDPARRIRKMSKGTKQKVGLVCAFMGRPDIVLLDEPTSGLDPLMQSRFIDLVLEEKRRGATILLSSHLFEEVERTCDRMAFIRAGRLAGSMRMDDVRRSRKRLFSVAFASAAERERYLAAHPEARAAGDATAETAVAGAMDAFVKDLAAYRVADLSVREQSLEELFMHLYGAPDERSSQRSSEVEGPPGARDRPRGGGGARVSAQAPGSETRTNTGRSRVSGASRRSMERGGEDE